jgi:gamma-glutamyl-gamma-aminobutyrate hydrolase PuuD
MTGAKVIPIFSYSSKENILSQLEKVNGVIFPGGEEYLSIKNIWVQNAQTVL